MCTVQRTRTLTLALIACLALAAPALAQTSRPVDTTQFGLLQLGWSQATVLARLGPPAHVETDTRTALVPVWGSRRSPVTGRQPKTDDGRPKTARRRHAPTYVVVTTDVEWWYYPAGGGTMATVLEFRNGELYAKDKYR